MAGDAPEPTDPSKQVGEGRGEGRLKASINSCPASEGAARRSISGAAAPCPSTGSVEVFRNQKEDVGARNHSVPDESFSVCRGKRGFLDS